MVEFERISMFVAAAPTVSFGVAVSTLKNGVVADRDASTVRPVDVTPFVSRIALSTPIAENPSWSAAYL